MCLGIRGHPGWEHWMQKAGYVSPSICSGVAQRRTYKHGTGPVNLLYQKMLHATFFHLEKRETTQIAGHM